MHRTILVAGIVALLSSPVSAQSLFPWLEPGSARPASSAPKAKQKKKEAAPAARAYRASAATPGGFFSFWGDDDDDDDDDRPRRVPKPTGPALADGGPRPDIDPQSPTEVSYASGQPAGTIVIDSTARRLYLVQGPSTALAYPVSVGREGFTWTGTEKISRVADWPDWHPPAEMRERDPKLPIKMTGGIRNPLGAKALYLGNSLYRIHGTSDARSIGRAASSGCFRMHNRHVVDLARRVGVGTKVVVVKGSGTRTASER